MDSIYVLRGRLEELYARNSKVYDKILQFILAAATFMVINRNIGFMKAAASPVVSLGLAVICTFLPLSVTVVMATALVLAHMYSVSLGILAMTAVLFLFIYRARKVKMATQRMDTRIRLACKNRMVLFFMYLSLRLWYPYTGFSACNA